MEAVVCSIQSWVCHGYVGNKCSVFALQQLGIEVDPINSVHFSNHTGYKSWKGQVLSGDQIVDLFDGLVANKLANYSHLITGYVNSVATLRSIMKILTEMKQLNKNLIYGILKNEINNKEVLGDEGKLYVAKELVEIYKNEVIQHADILFPNQTECEYLTDMKITNEEEALTAIQILHSKYHIKHVIITSLNTQQDPNKIILIGSSQTTTESSKAFKIIVPKIDRYFTGTGDLLAGSISILHTFTSALVTGWFARGENLIVACEKAVNSLQAVLQRTFQENSKELRLIQSKEDICNPQINLKAQLL